MSNFCITFFVRNPVDMVDKKGKKRNVASTEEVAAKKCKIMPPVHIVPFFPNEMQYLEQNQEVAKKIASEFLENASPPTPRRIALMQSSIPGKLQLFQRLQHVDPKLETWTDKALKLPLGKYSPPPVDVVNVDAVSSFLTSTREKMDVFVSGHDQAKDSIIKIICNWCCNPESSPTCMGFQGPPGIGKTVLGIKAISECVDRPFVFIGIGGVNDGSFLTGHSFTYDGALPGRIADGLSEAGVMNPVIFIDEVDKISNTSKGDEVTNALIHLIDKEQNFKFRDKYFHGIDLDLSKAMFIFSFNDENAIHPILKDRIKIIRLQAPNLSQKTDIALKHLVPKALKNCSLTSKDVLFTEECIQSIAKKYTNEDGVRELQRIISDIAETANICMKGGFTSLSLFPDTWKKSIQRPFVVTEKEIDVLMKREKKGNVLSDNASCMYL